VADSIAQAAAAAGCQGMRECSLSRRLHQSGARRPGADLARSLGRIELWRGAGVKRAAAGWGRGLDLSGLSQGLSGNGFGAGRRIEEDWTVLADPPARLPDSASPPPGRRARRSWHKSALTF